VRLRIQVGRGRLVAGRRAELQHRDHGIERVRAS
jgi:hypothetical protein